MSRDDGPSSPRKHPHLRSPAGDTPARGWIPAALLDPLYEQKTGSVDPQGQRQSTPLKAETSRYIGGTSDWLVA